MAPNGGEMTGNENLWRSMYRLGTEYARFGRSAREKTRNASAGVPNTRAWFVIRN